MCIEMLTRKFYKQKKYKDYPIVTKTSITGKISMMSSSLENGKIAYLFMIKGLKRIFVYYTDNYEQIFKTNDIVSIDNYTKENIYLVESIKKI